MAGPPRSEPTPRRGALPNGMWGIALFICTEGAFFGTLVASYFYLRVTNAVWPPRGIAAPSVALPLALTAGLIATCVPMHAASRAARGGRAGAAAAFVAVATLAQAGYLAAQIVSYLHDLDKFSITGTAYGSIYFTMLGADHAHVAIGLLLNLWLLARLTGGLTDYRATAVRVVSWYWAFVAAVSVVVVFAQVSPS